MEAKEHVMKQVAKHGAFEVTRKTAPSYIRAADQLVSDGRLKRVGAVYLPQLSNERIGSHGSNQSE